MRIAVFTAHSSEYWLVNPIITRLKNCIVAKPEEASTVQCDFAIVPCDRREMVDVALTLYRRGIPFAHFHSAGDLGSGHEDDINRHLISRMASIMFTNTKKARERLISYGEEPWRIHAVGSTAFDDLEIDESLCPKKPYVLVWFPEPMRFLGGTYQEELVNYRPFVWLEKRVPRPQFLGLLKNCELFITNSSSGIYEAPYFKVPVRFIGDRNKFREIPENLKPGASDRIVKILGEIDYARVKQSKRIGMG